MNVRWGMVIATAMFAVTIGLAFGWPWACLPTGLAFAGTVVGH
jgi:hypothetical protein